MTIGRPRTSIPSDQELIKLGEDLVTWASTKVKGELRCRWCEWYAKKQFLIRKQWKRMLDTDSFRPYYEIAQAYLSEKYLDGTINASIAHRYLRIYDPELKEQEDIDANEETARKASALKSETKAIEEEKLKVIDEVNRNKKSPT